MAMSYRDPVCDLSSKWSPRFCIRRWVSAAVATARERGILGPRLRVHTRIIQARADDMRMPLLRSQQLGRP